MFWSTENAVLRNGGDKQIYRREQRALAWDWMTGLWTVESGDASPDKVENDSLLLPSVKYLTTETH